MKWTRVGFGSLPIYEDPARSLSQCDTLFPRLDPADGFRGHAVAAEILERLLYGCLNVR